MEEFRVTLGDGGRIIIPAAYRKAMNIRPGDELVLRLQEGELRVFQQMQAMKRLRESVKQRAKNFSVEDFLAFRKQDGSE